jgi:predicted amidohydrolase
VFLAAAAAHFGRDLDFDLDRVESIVASARRAGARLLVLPDGTLGGYLTDLRGPPVRDGACYLDLTGADALGEPGAAGRGLVEPGRDPARFTRSDEVGPRYREPPAPGLDDLPPALRRDDPIFERVAELAGDMVLCLGYREHTDGVSYNSAVCLSGAGVYGRHRKVHLAPGELAVYAPGDRFESFDTPVGRLGMLIDYDKTFPESARTLAQDGATVLACLSAWPASFTDPARRVVKDRQARLFDLYDCARAAENQVILVSANQTGRTGALNFLGNAKVVGPGGEIRARTWAKAGLAVAEIDPVGEVSRVRRVLHHLAERRPSAYRGGPVPVD